MRWTRDDYAHPAPALAPRLIGAKLVHVVRGQRRAGIIVETEAYCGAEDDCSHAHNNRRTPRTEPMFGPPGLAYVYISHGLHRCMNVVCGTNGEASAVLIRALEPVEGVDAMRRARARAARKTPLRDRDLCSGPGKLGQALAITTDRSGDDMVDSPALWIEHAPPEAQLRPSVRTPRIGMNTDSQWGERPLRWVDPQSPHASRGRGGVLNPTPPDAR